MDYSDLSLYDYSLPQGLIAQKPSSPRDNCRLLVYNRSTKQIINDRFYNLTKYLPKDSLLIMNNTKVIPARIMAKRQTGGKVELLVISELGPKIMAMVSRQLPIKEELILNGGLKITVVKPKDRFYEFSTSLEAKELLAYFEKYGQMPIPPYIKHPDSLARLKTQYQTIFARYSGSIAAPTASLHFTQRLLKKLPQQQIKTAYVTLHVGLGTFLPLTKQNFTQRRLHQEIYAVKPLVWRKIMNHYHQKKRIIAIGTTVARTLESITRTLELSNETTLFIKPPYRFKLVNGLLTNFHLPKSSLLLLVSSFIRDRQETLALYRYAVSQKYRFYSFGDAMLIL